MKPIRVPAEGDPNAISFQKYLGTNPRAIGTDTKSRRRAASDELLIQIIGPDFCAGLVASRLLHRVTDAAPILRQAIGRDVSHILSSVRIRGWEFYICGQDKQPGIGPLQREGQKPAA